MTNFLFISAFIILHHTTRQHTIISQGNYYIFNICRSTSWSTLFFGIRTQFKYCTFLTMSSLTSSAFGVLLHPSVAKKGQMASIAEAKSAAVLWGEQKTIKTKIMSSWTRIFLTWQPSIIIVCQIIHNSALAKETTSLAHKCIDI